MPARHASGPARAVERGRPTSSARTGRAHLLLGMSVPELGRSSTDIALDRVLSLVTP
jgi:hypothetical protein